MMITQEQLRAGRALVHLDQAELARRAHVSPVTIRRIEAADGPARVSPTTLESVRRALEEAGVEFIPRGVKRARHKLTRRRGFLSCERSASAAPPA
jgi:transcriptional regulator with XRE-family HTH domain